MRTFIAFDLSSQTKNTIKQIQDNYRKIASGKISYTKSTQYHMTVFFLGELGEKGVNRIIGILDKSSFNNPFSLQFKTLDYFPSLKHPRIIVLKSETDHYLTDYVKKLDIELLNLGFKRDKKWLPHITLGRIRNSFSAGEFNISPFSAEIASITLYKSTLTPEGPVYDKLFEIKIPSITRG